MTASPIIREPTIRLSDNFHYNMNVDLAKKHSHQITVQDTCFNCFHLIPSPRSPEAEEKLGHIVPTRSMTTCCLAAANLYVSAWKPKTLKDWWIGTTCKSRKYKNVIDLPNGRCRFPLMTTQCQREIKATWSKFWKWLQPVFLSGHHVQWIGDNWRWCYRRSWIFWYNYYRENVCH